MPISDKNPGAPDLNIMERRTALYKEPGVERLLRELFEKDAKIEPSFDLEYGYRYPQVEKLTGHGVDETKSLLNKMTDLGIFNKEKFDEGILCPKCRSPNITINYSCPYDNSKEIERDSLIEHLACGHIDTLSHFKRENDLVCPRCKANLTPGSYRNAGSWNTCGSCGRRLESLWVLHKCRKCGATFTFEDAQIQESYIYSLSEFAKADIKRGVFFASQLREIVERHGYSITTPLVLKGSSGIDYDFDLIATTKEGKRITIDVNFGETKIARNMVMEMSGKYRDVGEKSYLIIAPKTEPENQNLADSLQIKLVQGETPGDALESFSQILASDRDGDKTKPSKRSFFSNLKKALNYWT
ncbi:MAG: hypothetical protein Q8O47_04390 [Candidatus Bathyarchaeota archaeon]|nr:hypothetical protein [Candidatus Bathyarchaeota archaeon]